MGYWEDVGTIKSFFDANLALTEQVFCHICILYCIYICIESVSERLSSILLFFS